MKLITKTKLNLNYFSQQKKIVVMIKGGLGNQLFCFAAAKRLAVMNEAELVIDSISGFSNDFQHRREFALHKFNIKDRVANSSERFEPLGKFRRRIFRLINYTIPFRFRRYIRQNSLDFDFRLLDLKFRSSLYLDGMWQSEEYFKDISSILLKNLKISAPKDHLNQVIFNKIIRSSNPVCVHVRWFESPEKNTSTLNLSKDYYLSAIRKIESLIDNPTYYIFSDNLVATERLFSNCFKSSPIYVGHNKSTDMAYADLWLMTMCKHFILSNSTLNWWGAWLARKKEIVMYPEKNFFLIQDNQYKYLFSAFSSFGLKISKKNKGIN